MKIILGFIFFVSQISLFSPLPWSSVPASEPIVTNVQQSIPEHIPTYLGYGLSAIGHRLRAPLAHDYHISNFEIEYNAETKALEIIAKIFIDDLEDGIAASGVEEKLYLCTDREIESGDGHVYDYLTSKMNITVEGKEMPFNFIGKEASEDLVAMYCYLEVEGVESVSEITISNNMLMDLFDDQINIVKLKSKSTGKRGFMMLKKGEHSDTVALQ